MSLNGIDISSYQSGIDLSVVPCDFVIVKATEGSHYVNPFCDKQYQQAKQNNKLLGVYHYANGVGAEQEAEYFLKNIKGYIGEAILCLDWEEHNNSAFSQHVSYAKTFLDYVYDKTGIRPLIYMSKSVTNIVNWKSVAENYGLWCAQYFTNNPVIGYQSYPWTDNTPFGAWGHCAIYQYSGNGKLDGYSGSLDLDMAYINADGWKAYATGEAKQNEGTKAEEIKQDSTLMLVYDTMLGKYGTGEQRKQKLGIRYNEVQDFINHIYSASDASLAKETLLGKYGNGEIRSVVLGTKYRNVQNIIDGISVQSSVYHTVKSGETLTSISKLYSVPVNTIVGLNNISNPDMIYSGQKLRIK